MIKWNTSSRKNSKKRYPQNGLTLVECILDMFPKISKIENVYLYTITELTHLFIDIKHIRPVTGSHLKIFGKNPLKKIDRTNS